MRKNIQHFFQTIFSGQLDFKERINRLIMLLVFACSVIGIALVFLGADSRVLYALIPIGVISGLSIRITLKQHNSKKASWLLAIGTNVVFFPLLFITSGGTQSGMPVWFVLGLVYIFLLFEGRSFVIAITLSLLSFLSAYLFAYYRPDLIPASTRFYTFSDSFVALLCVSAFIGILLKLQAKTYEQEKQIAEQQRKEVEQIARSKDTFFANMSHEIRTPINTIIGLNEMILREDISDEIAENAINIQNASKMLLTTINDILDLSKLESGKMDIVPTQYEISSMFSDLVNLIWIRAHQKNLEFKVDIDPEIPSMLYGDEVRIKQVVTNMLTNAVKYTESGSVTLSAKGERISADQILLRICVEDTGMGIRKESLDDLFRSFKRVDESDNRNIEGTGLGLTISKQLIEMMGGKITVDSVYHKGSVFTIELQQRIINVHPIAVLPPGPLSAEFYCSRRPHSGGGRQLHEPDGCSKAPAGYKGKGRYGRERKGSLKKDCPDRLPCDSDGSYDAGYGRGRYPARRPQPDKGLLPENPCDRPDRQRDVRRGAGLPEYGLRRLSGKTHQRPPLRGRTFKIPAC